MFVFFRKIWCALLSCYLRFGIRSFALLPTSLVFIFTILNGMDENTCYVDKIETDLDRFLGILYI